MDYLPTVSRWRGHSPVGGLSVSEEGVPPSTSGLLLPLPRSLTCAPAGGRLLPESLGLGSGSSSMRSGQILWFLPPQDRDHGPAPTPAERCSEACGQTVRACVESRLCRSSIYRRPALRGSCADRTTWASRKAVSLVFPTNWNHPPAPRSFRRPHLILHGLLVITECCFKTKRDI